MKACAYSAQAFFICISGISCKQNLHVAELVEIIVLAGWGDALHKYGIIEDPGRFSHTLRRSFQRNGSD
jgi:hypothetical protein